MKQLLTKIRNTEIGNLIEAIVLLPYAVFIHLKMKMK